MIFETLVGKDGYIGSTQHINKRVADSCENVVVLLQNGNFLPIESSKNRNSSQIGEFLRRVGSKVEGKNGFWR